MRTGIGYDIHRLVRDRRLVLGGIEIPYERGLQGHSDADVLIHAVCDSLLGAAGLDDIGHHFPDTDPAYADIDSSSLLEKTLAMVLMKGFMVGNLDVTVFAEAPKLSAYREAIRDNLARLIGIDADRVNIKATTTEGLGAIGRGEGIAAMSVALLMPSSR